MNSLNRNEALSDLQELHSAVNYIKQKLKATGQKLDATSSSGLVQLNLSGLPYHHLQTSRPYHQESDALGAPWGAEQRNVQNVGRLDGRVGRQGGSRSRERNYTLVDPVCINKELVPSNLNLPKGIRPSRSSNFTPGASAVTSSSGKVTFSGAEKNPHLGKTGCRVTEAHYINNDGTRQFLSDSNSVLPGASDKLRKVVERQRCKAERRQGRTTRRSREQTSPPQSKTLHSGQNHSRRVPLVDCRGTCTEEEETQWSPMSTGPADSVDRLTCKRRIKRNVWASHHRLLPETPVVDDCVEDYLKFLKLRVEEKEREAVKDICTGLDEQGNHLGHHSQRQAERLVEPHQEGHLEPHTEDHPRTSANYLEQDLECHVEHCSERYTECHPEHHEEYDPKHYHEQRELKHLPIPCQPYQQEDCRLGEEKVSGIILKRKTVSMPQPFEYKGFSLSGSPKACRRAHRPANQPSSAKESPSKKDVVLKARTESNQKRHVTRSSKQSGKDRMSIQWLL